MDEQIGKKNKKNIKLVAIILFFALLIGFGIEKLLVGQFKRIMLESAKDINASFIELQAKRHLSDEDFLSKDYPAHLSNFEKFYQEIKTPDIFRIKIWNKDSVVIFSDERFLIGEKIKNDEVEEAFLGKLLVEIGGPVKDEHLFEKGYKEFLEIYIPIASSESNEIIGVVEPYYQFGKLIKTIFLIRLYLWFFLSLILVCFLIIPVHIARNK